MIVVLSLLVAVVAFQAVCLVILMRRISDAKDRLRKLISAVAEVSRLIRLDWADSAMAWLSDPGPHGASDEQVERIIHRRQAKRGPNGSAH